MQREDNLLASNNSNEKTSMDRRKRINRMKTAIVITVIILLVLPLICCIVLGIQVYKLQKQVDVLSSRQQSYSMERANVIPQYLDQDAYTVVNASNIEASIPQRQESSYDTSMMNTMNHIVEDMKDKIITLEQGRGTEELQETSNLAKEEPSETINLKNYMNENEIDAEIIGSSIGAYEGKKVYLTFDDGPSIFTDDILDILADYKVKATFFVIGKTDQYSKEIYQRIVNEGHGLGMHSYSHKYKEIYKSLEDFDKDFTKLWKLLYDTTGCKPSMYRFPGGSSNLANRKSKDDIIRYLNEKSIVYYDWNALNGDATGKVYTKEQLIDNVLQGVKKKQRSIVLLHDVDSKGSTVESLPDLLNILISEGAQILPLDETVPPIQQIKADQVK